MYEGMEVYTVFPEMLNVFEEFDRVGFAATATPESKCSHGAQGF